MCKLGNLGVNESQLSHEGFPMDDALLSAKGHMIHYIYTVSPKSGR